jgi:ABC-type uncharacterized transport system permease subunit
MKKYWHVINIGIQNTLVYRVNFLFRAAFGLIPLAAAKPAAPWPATRWRK